MEDRKKSSREISRLCIKRRAGEAFWFPDLNITVRVVTVSVNYARMAIDAPKNILILREEVERDERKR